MFTIRMGIPEMKEFWDDLLEKKKKNALNSDEEDLFKRFAKAIQFLNADPKHPGLQTHEIEPLSKKYGLKVWQSYLEKKKMRAEFTGYTDSTERRLQL